MMRNLSDLCAAHYQFYPSSAITSLAELLIKLCDEDAPNLQQLEMDHAIHWQDVLGQSYGRIRLVASDWDPAHFRRLLALELASQRAVGLSLRHTQGGERGWAAIDVHEVGQYTFVDLIGKVAEDGHGSGRFSESRVIRLDQIHPSEVAAVIYCEESMPRPARPLRLRRADRIRHGLAAHLRLPCGPGHDPFNRLDEIHLPFGRPLHESP